MARIQFDKLTNHYFAKLLSWHRHTVDQIIDKHYGLLCNVLVSQTACNISIYICRTLESLQLQFTFQCDKRSAHFAHKCHMCDAFDALSPEIKWIFFSGYHIICNWTQNHSYSISYLIGYMEWDRMIERWEYINNNVFTL